MTDRPAAAAPSPAGRRTADRLHLSPRHRAQLEALLREHLPGVEVWAYGSRITGESHDGSDLDLVLRAPDLQKIPVGRLSDLREALRESTIPFLVEARDWARLPEGFHGEIERDYVVLVASRTEGRETSTGIVRTDPEKVQYSHNEWPILSLHDAGILVMDCEHRTPPPAKEGYPYVAIPQVKNGRIDINGARRIAFEHFQEWTRKTAPEPHDVVLSRRCNPGVTGYVPEKTKFALGQNLVLLRSDETSVFKPFLRWLTRGPQWWEQVGIYLNVGAVFDSLKCADIPYFHLAIPPQAEQRAIAYVLGVLDDKIELNRRMNETLEAMARALFKSWFVDFDPVRAKMAGRDTGLPTEIAELFPDRMVDSKLGRTPEGWSISTLGDYLDATRGLSYKGSALSENGVAMHNLNSIREGGGYKYGGLKYYDGPCKERHAAHPGDVIVANTEQGHDRRLVGYAAIVPGRHRNGLFSHHLYRVRAKEPFNSEYVCHLLNTAAMHDAVSGYATGTTVNMLPSDALWIPEILVPEPRIVAAFGTVAATISDRVEAAHEESENLACLRDSLLPRLVSGELRVGQMDPPVRCA